MFESTKNYIDGLVFDKKIPYIDVCVIKNGLPVFRYLSGDGREELTGKENLLIYSATKPLTVVCVARLIEEGKLFLDDKVSKYLPEYNDVFLLDEKGNKVAPKTDITILHLLTMTAGLTYDYDSYKVREEVEKRSGDMSTIEVAKHFTKTPLAFSPGEDRKYSLCHDVLGAVIEVVTGKKLSEYMEEIIFKPLGMKNTSFSEKGIELANQYECSLDGEVNKVESQLWFKFSPSYESGGAGLISTVEDYSLFATALSEGGEVNGYRLLKKESIEMIKKERLKAFSVESKFTCVQGSDYGYGLGVRTRTKKTEWGLPNGEFGWDGAGGTYLLVDTENKINVVIGMSLLNWPVIFKGEHLYLVERIYKQLVKV